ncbi:MAG TPA: hypothetical protein VH639_01215 [Bryobacteraceae bacterium]
MVLRVRITSRRAGTALFAAERFLQAPVGRSAILVLRRGARTLAAAGLALCAHVTANVPDASFNPWPDPRFVRLQRFFQHYRCPSPQYIAAYIRASDRYRLDYRLLPALSIRETQCGLHEKQNNRWGYHSGRQSFPSVAQGIDFMAHQLVENPPYKGKTLRQKLLTYNPRPAYSDEVAWIMRQIE